MKVLITGACGFVGHTLAQDLLSRLEGLEILGIDNLSRPGSEQNRRGWQPKGMKFWHGDLRNPSDLENLPSVDWVIDAAANPSVLAGIANATSSRQLMEHNLVSTIHLLEYAKRHRAGFIMLSTSRVYSIGRLSGLPLDVREGAFVPRFAEITEPGCSPEGVSEAFSTHPPVSLYGAAKLASEILALEYGKGFDLPVHVNRCGVLAGGGQFGKADQGIFSFWIHSYARKRPLKFIGFKGSGCQVRDCLHPRDLAALLARQMHQRGEAGKILNVAGGRNNSISLAGLNDWCACRFGPHEVVAEPRERPFDVPWLVLDSTLAMREYAWRPTVTLEVIFEEIASHAAQHPEWLDISNGG